MKALAVASVVLLALGLGACASTTVIMLADEDGTVGAVSVKTGVAEQTLDRAYHRVRSAGMTSQPSRMQEMGATLVNEKFKDILNAQPAKAKSFVVYFVSGGTELTEASSTTMAQVLKAINEAGPTEVSVIGHADSTGSREINERIALERAAAVGKLLKAGAPAATPIELRSFGDKDPLVATPPNTPEPRNRRVEILVL